MLPLPPPPQQQHPATTSTRSGRSRSSSSSSSTAEAAVRWDAATLTATVSLGVVEAAQGASVRVIWAESPLSELLCSSSTAQNATGWPRLHERLLTIKRAIDWEASIGTEPSMLLNALANTAVRMQDTPHTAKAELESYRARLAQVVALHTTGADPEGGGLPSIGLQRVLKAWLTQ